MSSTCRLLPVALALALALCLAPLALALQVAPGSSCASACLDKTTGNPDDPNASTIKPDDIVCNDVGYWSLAPGVKFRTCMDCLQNSTTTAANESDLAWYLCKEPASLCPLVPVRPSALADRPNR